MVKPLAWMGADLGPEIVRAAHADIVEMLIEKLGGGAAAAVAQQLEELGIELGIGGQLFERERRISRSSGQKRTHNSVHHPDPQQPPHVQDVIRRCLLAKAGSSRRGIPPSRHGLLLFNTASIHTPTRASAWERPSGCSPALYLPRNRYGLTGLSNSCAAPG